MPIVRRPVLNPEEQENGTASNTVQGLLPSREENRMNEIAIVDDRPERLIIPTDITFDEWWAFRENLRGWKDARKDADIRCAFQTMDWLFGGEEIFGNDADQGTAFVEDEMGWGPRTYAEYYRIWRRFQPDKRVDGLGITFYQAVMNVPGDNAIELLHLAERLDWTRDQLRVAAREATPEGLKAKPKVTKRELQQALESVIPRVTPVFKDGEGYYRIEEEDLLALAELVGVPALKLVIEQEELTIEQRELTI